MKHIKYLLLLLLPMLSACIKKADIPAYIHIDRIGIVTDPLKEGSAVTGVTDVWVYMDNNLQGVYELPTDFPVIGSGKHNFRFLGGIKRNGQANDRGAYHLFVPIDTSLTLVPDQKQTIILLNHYDTAIKFVWKEDFENSIHTFMKTGKCTLDTLYRLNGSGAWNGGYSAMDTLRKLDIMEYASTNAYSLPGNGVETYIEFSYKSDLPLEVGFFQASATGVEQYPVIIANSSTEWKHLYLHITEDVGAQILKRGASIFKPYIYASNASDTTKLVWIDNLKLIHR
ncbi:MAG: hypothetical protein EXR21_03190 [Flavobacteriaceae bacterium]|nr:hypothetical protein [Flavobacteriaceae bacterium]